MFKIKFSTNFDPARAANRVRRDANISEIEKLSNATILVGFPASAKNDDGLTIAKYARWNNYGAIMHDEAGNATGRIPSRPFFTEGFYFQKYQERRVRLAKTLLSKLAHKKITASQAAELIGIEAQENVKDAIQNGPWAPNAPSVLARKLRKSKGRKNGQPVKPLIDTGDMINAVTYLVDIQ